MLEFLNCAGILRERNENSGRERESAAHIRAIYGGFDITNNADDLARRSVHIQELSNWISVRKLLAYKFLIDNDDLRRVRRIGVREEPTLQQRNVQRAEIIQANRTEVGRKSAGFAFRRKPNIHIATIGKRQASANDRGAFNSGRKLNFIQNTLIKMGDLCRIHHLAKEISFRRSRREFLTSGPRLQSKNRTRIESRIGVQQISECLNEQSGARQQNQRKRNLRNSQRVSQAAARESRGCAANGFFQRIINVRFGRLKCGSNSKEHASEQRNQRGEHKRPGVKRNGVGARQVRRRESKKQLETPIRNEKSQGAADGGQYKTFGEQLTKQSHAARAQRSADREFLPSRRGARHQQICHVGARDQQHKSNRTEEHQDLCAVAERSHVNQWLGVESSVIA